MIVALVLIVVLCILVLLMHLKYPFVFQHYSPQMWSVGLGTVSKIGDPLIPEILLTYRDIKRITGYDYIADPFIIRYRGEVYLFVEAAIDNFGRVDAFKLTPDNSWHYEGIAVEADFHFSYPQVVTYQDKVYMLPETKGDGCIALYETDSFPLKWKKTKTLVEGKYLDATLIVHENQVYLFAATRDYKLYCFVSDDLLNGTFNEHPFSPLGIGEKMRPAGRPFFYDGKWIIPVQSRRKGYGYAVHSLVISELSPQRINYKKGPALARPINELGYFKHGVHHLDLQKDGDGYIFVMDGRVGTKIKYWRVEWKLALTHHYNDVLSFFMILKNNLKSSRLKSNQSSEK